MEMRTFNRAGGLLLPNADIAAGRADATFIFGIICAMWNINIATLCICREAVASVRSKIQINVAARSRNADRISGRDGHINIASRRITGKTGISSNVTG